jgi:hypothetical protein
MVDPAIDTNVVMALFGAALGSGFMWLNMRRSGLAAAVGANPTLTVPSKSEWRELGSYWLSGDDVSKINAAWGAAPTSEVRTLNMTPMMDALTSDRRVRYAIKIMPDTDGADADFNLVLFAVRPDLRVVVPPKEDEVIGVILESPFAGRSATQEERDVDQEASS